MKPAPCRVSVVRIDCRRRHRLARRMYALGWPPHRIAATLGLPRARLDVVLREPDHWVIQIARTLGVSLDALRFEPSAPHGGSAAMEPRA
jgi:hypothetical protein